jgi:hypothetical protein
VPVGVARAIRADIAGPPSSTPRPPDPPRPARQPDHGGHRRPADVARGTLYLYFDSVDSVIVALQDRYAQALAGELEPLLATGGSGSRLRPLDAFIAGLASAPHGHRDLHHALFTGTLVGEAPLTQAFCALLRRFHPGWA